MRERVVRSARGARALLTLNVLVLAFLLALLVTDHWFADWPSLILPTATLLLWFVALTRGNPFPDPFSYAEPPSRLLGRSLTALTIGGTAAYLFPLEMAQDVFLWFATFGIIAVLSIRFVDRILVRHRIALGGRKVPVVAIGSRRHLEQIILDINGDEDSLLEVIAVVLGEGRKDEPVVYVRGLPVLGEVDRLPIATAVFATGAEGVIISDGAFWSRHDFSAHALALRRLKIPVAFAMPTDAIGQNQMHPLVLGRAPLVVLHQQRIFGPVAKRIFDVALASLILVFLLPVMTACAIAVRVGSSGPVLYRQTRIGLDGKPFAMLKFRTMYVDSDRRMEVLLEQLSAEERFYTIHNDPRVTPIGRFLRRHFVDELPQLLNVIKGDMSLVGPRPPLPGDMARYGPRAAATLSLKPGLTGLAAIGSHSLSWEEAVRLDYYYAENWTLALDLKILGRTFLAALTDPWPI